MLGESFSRLSVEGMFRELGELVEGTGIKIYEGGSGRWVSLETSETGGCASFEVLCGFDGRQLAECASHGGQSQWVESRIQCGR
jgi:hypothetical protein